MALTFKWADGSEHDFDKLPPASRAAMVSRAVTRIVGNEAASHALNRAKQHIAENSTPKRKAANVTSREASDWMIENPDMVDQFTAAFHKAKLEAILQGTLGVRSEGVSAFERETYRIARGMVTDYLRATKTEFPADDDDEEFEANGKQVTVSGLIDNLLGQKKHRENVEAQAKASLEAKAKARLEKAAAREAAVKSNFGASLGL